MHFGGLQHDHSDVPGLPPPGRAVPRYDPRAESEDYEPSNMEEQAPEGIEEETPAAGEEEEPVEEEMPLAMASDPFRVEPDQQEDQEEAHGDCDGGAKDAAAAQVSRHVNTHGTVCEFFNIAEDEELDTEGSCSHMEQLQVKSQLLESQVQHEVRSCKAVAHLRMQSKSKQNVTVVSQPEVSYASGEIS